MSEHIAMWIMLGVGVFCLLAGLFIAIMGEGNVRVPSLPWHRRVK